MSESDVRAIALEILGRAEVAYLSTVDADGYPHTRAVFNLRHGTWFPRQAALWPAQPDDLRVYLSTSTSSLKVRQLEANPRGSVYYCLVRESSGLLLVGDLEVVADREIRHAVWNEGWEKYYPGGPDGPEHTVLRLRPRRAEGWHASRRFAFEIERQG